MGDLLTDMQETEVGEYIHRIEKKSDVKHLHPIKLEDLSLD